MIKKTIILALRVYKRAISPLLPPSCRFYPTCSDYAAQAIDGHGVLKGFYLASRRLLRCHPFNSGGFDPVPEACNDHGPGRHVHCKSFAGRAR